MNVQVTARETLSDFFIGAWKPLRRTEGNHIFKDALVAEGNLKKISARTFQIGQIILGGMLIAGCISNPVSLEDVLATLVINSVSYAGFVTWHISNTLGDEDISRCMREVLANLSR